MPEKSRERRVKIAKRQGRSTAIKATDVGMAKGLSRHAAKKSSHVVGMRTGGIPDRHVSRKSPPGRGKLQPPPGIGAKDRIEALPRDEAELPRGRVAGIERERSQQKILTRRTPSQLAAKEARRRK